MGTTICISSHKGGVGKTTTAINLAAALALAEKDTLLVDTDPVGQAIAGLTAGSCAKTATLGHGLDNRLNINQLPRPSQLTHLKVMPAGASLSRAETTLTRKPEGTQQLRRLLSGYSEKFDYIVIDAPPGINPLSVSALAAADWVLVPLQCEFYALYGLARMLRTIKIMRREFNPGLKLAGILLTMFDRHDPTSRAIARAVDARLGHTLCQTVIPRQAEFARSAARKTPVVLTDSLSSGAQGYLALAHELMHGVCQRVA
jgi:chromosome partitioning protein